MAMPFNPFARAAAIMSSGLETPSPEKKECVWRSMLNGITTRRPVLSTWLRELFYQNACFGVKFFRNAIELVIVQSPVIAGFFQQFGMRPDLLDVAPVHYDDLVGGQDGG